MVRFHVPFSFFTLVAALGLVAHSCFCIPTIAVEALVNPGLSSKPANSSTKNKMLIIGLGRVGKYVADLAIENKDARVFGTVRQSSSQIGDGDKGSDSNEIVRIPFDPVAVKESLFGCTDDQVANKVSIEAATHVLFTIPLSREKDPIMEAVLNEVRDWWEMKTHQLDGSDNDCHSKVLGILSTTGVYGNHDGKVVTEDSGLLCGETSNAALYQQFEDDWISRSAGDDDDNNQNRRLCIFRCAGIYDSSRSALHTLYKNYESGNFPAKKQSSSSPTPTTGNKTNRIHSFDLARGVLSAMFREGDSEKNEPLESTGVRIYNLSDDLPEVRAVVLSYAQELFASIGIDQSAFSTENEKDESTNQVESNESTLTRSSKTRQRRRERESKIVCNNKMREELLPKDGLTFPTYKEGLRDILNDPTTP
eukprot:CAMPEP_0116136754 /NCGR_PEP_ID=MMETSP0329-20121206/11897_1 /TAXON_ID=697910 /ORGANISM="Pseudo-nitzschia arenysensis, Strain B593" /LENGTH=421 /DNA_ID=CAMNT_0003631651 /DNA_START=179 /DNA_END=1441 /DNA_ORIENTATION=-